MRGESRGKAAPAKSGNQSVRQRMENELLNKQHAHESPKGTRHQLEPGQRSSTQRHGVGGEEDITEAPESGTIRREELLDSSENPDL